MMEMYKTIFELHLINNKYLAFLGDAIDIKAEI